MLGEERTHIDVNERGVEGDRLFAVRDLNGKFGSGKTTRRFRKIDGLFGFSASYHQDDPSIVFPDGRSNHTLGLARHARPMKASV